MSEIIASAVMETSSVGRTLALLLFVAATGCGAPAAHRDLTLATTTSVAHSGLLDVLFPAFQQQHGVVVYSHLVGSGLALGMMARGDADVAITHAPEAEARALNQYPQWRYRKVMFNDFVLVGPTHDPADASDAEDVGAAMQRIAASDVTFLSRGDRSGTHEREQQLWHRSGARPSTDRLVVAGGGMGATLRIASETGAYTLTDRATWAQHADMLQLRIVFEGGTLLLNTYAITFDPTGSRIADAQTFFEWLSEGSGRRIIESYRIRGRPAFSVWPEGVPASDPLALPFPDQSR